MATIGDRQAHARAIAEASPGALAPAEAPASEESAPEFVPLRRATRPERTRLFIIGPLLWVCAVVVVAHFDGHDDAIQIALIVLGAAALLALLVLVPMRVRRVRQERDPL